MENTTTDQFNLVQVTHGRDFIGLFAPSISPIGSFSLEAFRGPLHVGSILSSEIVLASDVRRRYGQMGVRYGDTIVRVDLGSRTLDLTGELPTRDGFRRVYEIILEIRVAQPTSFALAYLQRSDPLQLAKLAIEHALRAYAYRHDHDDIDPTNLRYAAQEALNRPSNQKLGIIVTQAQEAILRIDPSYIKMQGYDRESMMDSSKQVEDDREIVQQVVYRESSYYQQETLHERELIKDKTFDPTITRILKQITEGMSLEEILKNNPESQDLFQLSSRVSSIASFPPAEDQKKLPHTVPEDNFELENQTNIDRKDALHTEGNKRRVDMDQYTYYVTFDEASSADVSQYADELGNALLDATPDITIQRTDPQAQEPGSTLVLVFRAPVILVVATAIVNWLKLRNQASLTMKTADEQIIVQNISSKDAAQLAHLLLTQRQEEKPYSGSGED